MASDLCCQNQERNDADTGPLRIHPVRMPWRSSRPRARDFLKQVLAIAATQIFLDASRSGNDKDNRLLSTELKPDDFAMSELTPDPSVSRRALPSLIVRSLAIVVLASALLSLLARHWWISDLIANLRIQLLLSLIGITAVCFVARQKKTAVVLSAVLLWQISWILPVMSHAPRPAASFALKVCTINVLTQNMQYDRIIAALKKADPDIIAVLELGTTLERKLMAEFRNIYPHRVMEPNDSGNFGIGLLSKLPLQDARIFKLSTAQLPSIQATARWNGQTLHLMATHPIPPVNSQYFAARNDHLNRLAERIRNLNEDSAGQPVIVLGDLNLTPWSPIYADFLQQSSLKDSLGGDGISSLRPTWYRWPWFPFGLILDHGFASPNLVCTRRSVLEDIGSDHRPVLLEYAHSSQLQ